MVPIVNSHLCPLYNNYYYLSIGSVTTVTTYVVMGTLLDITYYDISQISCEVRFCTFSHSIYQVLSKKKKI